jgi:hypothetical protein
MRVVGSSMAIGAHADDIVEVVRAFIGEFRDVVRFQVRLVAVSAERSLSLAKLAATSGSPERIHFDGLFAFTLNHSPFYCSSPG